MSEHRVRYIAVEGVIGAGKTTLAAKLSDSLSGARLVLERFEDNPFLEPFYRDRERYAFQVQIFFLLSRYRQQLELAQYELFTDVVVSDYMFEKDEIFARLILNDTEFALYRQVADALKPSVARPDVVVFLRRSVDRLLANIVQRGRSYERSMPREYIEQLHDAYTRFFSTYTAAPVLVVDADSFDFVAHDDHFDMLRSRILAVAPGDGVQQLSTASSPLFRR